MFNVQARDCGVVLQVVLNKPTNDEDGDDWNDEGSLVSLTKGLRRMGSRIETASAMIRNSPLLRRGSQDSSNGGNGSKRLGGRRNTLSNVCSCLLRETDVISIDKFKLDQVSNELPFIYPYISLVHIVQIKVNKNSFC